MFNRILNSQTKNVGGAAFLLAFSALVSRILGLLRDRLLAGNFGAGPELDIYFASFKIPDLVYAILITGGISAAFLPVFSEYFKKDRENGWQLVNNVLNVFFILLLLIAGILAIFSNSLMEVIAPGFDQVQKATTIALTRVIFLGSIIFGLSGIFSSVLQYFNRFFVYSLAPILYNIGIILGILFFLPFYGLMGLAYGVVLGSLMHLLIQLPVVFKVGYRVRLLWDFKDPGLIKIFRLMLPRVFGQVSHQINLIAITAIASTLSAGSIAVLNLSQNLQYFPIGLIGVSFALASFPSLSRHWVDGNREKFLSEFSSTFNKIVFWTLPATTFIFLLRAQIVRLAFGTGQFGWLDTRLTAASLGIFAFGILAASLIPLLVRAFFSFQDTRTPVAIGIISVIFNILLALYLVWLLGFQNYFSEWLRETLKLQNTNGIAVMGLPLVLFLSSTLQLFLLIVFLKRKIGELNLKELMLSFGKILTASLFMGAVVYLSLNASAGFVDMQTFFGVLIQTVLAAVAGAFTYAFFALVFKINERYS